MYRVAIIENEPSEEAVLHRHLERYAAENGVALSIASYFAAKDFLAQHRSYDLVFMDIEMPEVNGMEAASLLRAYDARTLLVFVTSFAGYAVRSYEVDALDFIVKPARYANVQMCMSKAVRILDRRADNKLVVQTADGLRVLPVDAIVHVEVSGRELVYHLEDRGDAGGAPSVGSRGSLKTIEERLAASAFVRISNNELVNMEHVRRIDTDAIILDSGEVLKVSRSYKRSALDAVTAFMGGGF